MIMGFLSVFFLKESRASGLLFVVTSSTRYPASKINERMVTLNLLSPERFSFSTLNYRKIKYIYWIFKLAF